jgi:transcriptional regulator with XRE-family HTH domain
MPQTRNNILLQEIAKKFKTLRETKDIAQEYFYNDTGIHLARIESANFNSSVSTLEAVCKYFGLTLGQFFKGM